MPWPISLLVLMNLRHRADVCGAAVQRDRDKKGCGRDRVWGQAQHVGDLQRGIIHVWKLYEFLFWPEIWWLNWIFNVMKRWQVIFLSPPLLERRNHRWRFDKIRKKDFTVSGIYTFKVSRLSSKNSKPYFTFSADGLKEVLVNNYDEINARMEEGTVIQNSKEIRHKICQMFCTSGN